MTMRSAGSGSRLSTGGRFPVFTSSASMGASPNFPGNFVASRITSVPSSFPIRARPSLLVVEEAAARVVVWAPASPPIKATPAVPIAADCRNSRLVNYYLGMYGTSC
jgi:hypothetical protein